MNPLISVIIPCHNAGAYLKPAIESILSQDYAHWEILLVDDHSDDGSIEAIPEPILERARIKVLRSPERGVVSAFNTGLYHAKGDYVARMDADDVSASHRLNDQIEIFERNTEVGLVGGKVEFFGSKTIATGTLIYQKWLNSLITPEAIANEIYIESPLPNPTIMARRRLWESLEGYRDTDWPEDYDLLLRAHHDGVRMAKPERTQLFWRVHDGRVTFNDNRYSLNNFQRAKAHYFSSSRFADRNILIWGAGETGKLIYDLLSQKGLKIVGFIDISVRRIGGQKRGLPVISPEQIDEMQHDLIIGAAGSRGAREEIRAWLSNRDKKEGENYLFMA